MSNHNLVSTDPAYNECDHNASKPLTLVLNRSCNPPPPPHTHTNVLNFLDINFLHSEYVKINPMVSISSRPSNR